MQDIGWQGWVTDGKTAGTTGRSKRIEAIRIKVANAYADGDVEVRAHVQDIGWQGWVTSAGYAGTTGRGKRIEAVEVRLTGELAKLYDVWYRAHVQTIGWMAWTKDGASAGTTGASGRMEAIQVLLVRKGGSAPSADGQATEISFFSTPDVIYTAHSKDVGWQGARKDGATAGTTGQSRRLEAMTIKLTGGEDALSGGISYRAHVQGTGWQGWVSDGSIAGTTGQARRLEAFQVKLTGAIAKFFDVVYQAHVQNVGWQSWVSNGQVAGTVGRALAAEAFKVKLVLKGASSVVASGLDYCWLKSSPYWSGQVKVLLMNKHYSKGRYDASHGGQHVIKQIVIHHNEIVLGERGAGRRNVHDAIGHAHDGAELDVAVQLDDVHLLADTVVIGARDARVLGGHAHGAAPGIGSLCRAHAVRGLCHHKAAAAKAQVNELDEVDVGLDDGVAAADAAVRAAVGHESGGILRAHDDVIDVARRHDQPAAGVGELVDGQARCLEQLDRVTEEPSLGHRDAQRALRHAHARRHHAALALLAQDLLQTLEREHESAGSHAGEAIVREHRVVAATRGDRRGDALGIALEDDTRVVVEGVHHREVEA